VHPFRAAVEAQDAEAAAARPAEDVLFRSPIVVKPYTGRSATGAVLAAALRVFDDFVYEGELTSRDTRDHAFMLRARVDGKDIQGCDFLCHDQDGPVVQLTLVIMPLTPAAALSDWMAAELTRA
jgi:hypothetical protein